MHSELHFLGWQRPRFTAATRIDGQKKGLIKGLVARLISQKSCELMNRSDISESTIIKNSMESVVPVKCPVCGHDGMKSTVSTLELPMLGEAVQTMLMCPGCGFRTSDVMITAQSEPVRYTMKVESPSDINARVVRSTSGTIRIPELGISMEPGPASESFISNIEGVLMRVMEVLDGLDYDKENEKAVEERKKEIEASVNGKKPFTFIVEDPFGNSAILHEKAKKEVLSEKEAKSLKTGEMSLSLK